VQLTGVTAPALFESRSHGQAGDAYSWRSASTLTRDFVSLIGPSGVDKTPIVNIIA